MGYILPPCSQRYTVSPTFDKIYLKMTTLYSFDEKKHFAVLYIMYLIRIRYQWAYGAHLHSNLTHTILSTE